MDVQTQFFLLLLLMTLVLRIPYLGAYLKIINTLLHEVGHAVMALLTSGTVRSISLFTSTAGVATTASKNRIGRILTSMAGYPFASFMAFVCLIGIKQERYEWIFLSLLAIVLLSLLVWVRNVYGVLWLFSFGFLMVALYMQSNEQVVFYASLLIASVLSIESIRTAFVVWMLSIKSKKDAGDATNLSETTFISARIWGFVFFVQSLLFVAAGVASFL